MYYFFSSSLQEELLRRNSFNRSDYGSLELVIKIFFINYETPF